MKMEPVKLELIEGPMDGLEVHVPQGVGLLHVRYDKPALRRCALYQLTSNSQAAYVRDVEAQEQESESL